LESWTLERIEVSWILDGEIEMVREWSMLDVPVVSRHSAPRPAQAFKKIE
jgi:hypothetical protein